VTPAAGSYAGTLDASKLATRSDVMMSLWQSDVAFVDAREEPAFRLGHLPNAINYRFSYNAEAGATPVLKSADQLNAMYGGLGITPDKRVISYCYSGVHSCVTYVTLRLLGYPDVRVYTGSWDEWKLQPYAPREMSD
jgi:thiosulfate/3-mercaptopyruvate sulfurtransferase